MVKVRNCFGCEQVTSCLIDCLKGSKREIGAAREEWEEWV